MIYYAVFIIIISDVVFLYTDTKDQKRGRQTQIKIKVSHRLVLPVWGFLHLQTRL